MISNQILQNTIDGLKGITRIDLCIIDVEGKILAATFPDAEKYVEPAQAFVESPADSQVVNGYQFFKVFDEHQLEYILLANGDSDDVYMVGKIASFQIQNLLVAYKERFDKDNFIKNLLLDNLLLVDIYNRAKKLHIDTDLRFQKSGEWYLSLRRTERKMAMKWKRSEESSVANPRTLSLR